MKPTATETGAAIWHPHREIAAHFAGRARRAREAAMRAHLPHCASCRSRYDRHLLMAALDPRGATAFGRIARGLGLEAGGKAGRDLGPAGSPRRQRWALALAAPALLVAATVLVGVRPRHSPPASLALRQDFSARGSALPLAPMLWIYRLAPGGAPQVVDRTIGERDELAFAYSNPAGRARIVVFGVDEHRHVYWFQPAWTAGAAPPSAIAAISGPGPHELPEAVRHHLDGHELTVYTVLGDRDVSAGAVEAWAKRSSRLTPDDSPFGPDATMLRRPLQVLR